MHLRSKMYLRTPCCGTQIHLLCAFCAVEAPQLHTCAVVEGQVSPVVCDHWRGGAGLRAARLPRGPPVGWGGADGVLWGCGHGVWSLMLYVMGWSVGPSTSGHMVSWGARMG